MKKCANTRRNGRAEPYKLWPTQIKTRLLGGGGIPAVIIKQWVILEQNGFVKFLMRFGKLESGQQTGVGWFTHLHLRTVKRWSAEITEPYP